MKLTTAMWSAFRMVAYGWEPLQAVGIPRLHHQLLPPTVTYENKTRDWVPGVQANFTVSEADIDGLRQRGHNLTSGPVDANCQAIIIDPDSSTLSGASDPRKDGAPAGY